jgi:hypothetical protein
VPAVRDPTSILDAARRAALGYATQTGGQNVQALMKRSQAELRDRLKSIPPSDHTFTAVQMRATLKQIESVLSMTKRGLLGTVVQGADVIGKNSAAATIKYLGAAEKAYGGVAGAGLGINTAKVMDVALMGANASVLRRIANDPAHPGRPGVIDRYGTGVIEHFERTLQTSIVTGTPWNDVRQQLVDGSPFLQSAPQHWAERIIRTEYMSAHNQAGNLALNQIDAQTGGQLIRILCATFDDRTASDSYAVHGQIRRMTEPFVSWFGSYMTPPNRPNDREIIVPHHMEWPIPANLKPKTDAEVAARWAQEKRKGSPPSRPLMSTIPIEQIGVPTPVAPVEKPIDQQIMGEPKAAAMGSNPGGVYRGTDGVDRYVKLYSDPVQAVGEHLANRVYADLGLPALTSRVFEHDGKLAYASDMLPGTKTIGEVGITPALANRVLDGFVGDLLTANWDAAGMHLDNIVVTPAGEPIRIDNGGTFLSRAMGGRKPLASLNTLTEWDNLFDEYINPSYAKVAKAAGVSSASDMLPRIEEQLANARAVAKSAGGWKVYVQQHAPQLSPKDADAIAEMLESRESAIQKKLGEAKDKADLEAKIKAELEAKAVALAKLEAKAAAKRATELDLSNLHTLPSEEVPDFFGANVEIKPLKMTEDNRRVLDASLRRHEKAAIAAFTGSHYDDIRTAASQTKAQYEASNHDLPYNRAKEYADDLSRVLKKKPNAGDRLESQISEMYRGLKQLSDADFVNLINAKTIVFDAPTSTSYSARVANGFYGSGKSVMFRIKPLPDTTGVLIAGVSNHVSEHEILFGNNTKFKVTKVVRDAGKATDGVVMYLEELPPKLSKSNPRPRRSKT